MCFNEVLVYTFWINLGVFGRDSLPLLFPRIKDPSGADNN